MRSQRVISPRASCRVYITLARWRSREGNPLSKTKLPVVDKFSFLWSYLASMARRTTLQSLHNSSVASSILSFRLVGKWSRNSIVDRTSLSSVDIDPLQSHAGRLVDDRCKGILKKQRRFVESKISIL